MNEEINLENWEDDLAFSLEQLSEGELTYDGFKDWIKSLLAAKDTHCQKELEIADARWKRAEQYIAELEGEALSN